MARCFVTRQLPGAGIERLRAVHEVDVWPERLPPSYEELRRRAAGAEGLLTLLTDRIDAELIDGSPHLRAIANYAVGYDNIDLAATSARGIPVGNTPDVLTDATADLTFALLLAAARQLPQAIATVTAGDWLTWEPDRHLGHDVHGATLGIVGLGRIGRAVARRAEGFEMNVLSSSPGTSSGRGPGTGPDPGTGTGRNKGTDRDQGTGTARDTGTGTGTVAEVRFEQLLEEADFLSVHCPLTPATHHLIDTPALARMRPHAILINTARGPIVDPVALRRALVDGTIGAAALDVTDPEPLAADDPLLGAPNLIVAPHIGSATHTARERMTDLAVDNLLAALGGRPMPHQVTGEA